MGVWLMGVGLCVQARASPLRLGLEVQARVCAGSYWVDGRIISINADTGTFGVKYRCVSEDRHMHLHDSPLTLTIPCRTSFG